MVTAGGRVIRAVPFQEGALAAISSSVHVTRIDPRPGAQERDSNAFERSKGIARMDCRALCSTTTNRGRLIGKASRDWRIGHHGVATRTPRGGRVWRRTLDQLVETRLLKIARQQEMAAAKSDVEHETVRVVGSLRMPPVRTAT